MSTVPDEENLFVSEDDYSDREGANDGDYEHNEVDYDDSDENNDETMFGDEEDDFDEESDDEYIDDEEDMDQFREDLKGAAGFKVKNKKKGRYVSRTINDKSLDPEVKDYLSRAHEEFIHNNYDEAEKLYENALAIDTANSTALRQLADISGIRGDHRARCKYLMRAAQASKVDAQLWDTVAELSLELGYVPWAIKSYTRIISLKGKNRFQYIHKRAILYKTHKIFGRALDGFRKLHQRYPLNSLYLKEVASIYVEQKRTSDAINLYLDILERNIIPKENEVSSRVPRFGFQELNILCELYINKHEWAAAIRIIKVAARYIQGRNDEQKIWEEADNDSEFDERRFDILRSFKSKPEMFDREYELPVDIKFKLGLLRLELDDKEEAMRHFEELFQEQEDVSDLFYEAGKALEMHGYYSDALRFLTKSIQNDGMSQDIDLITVLAKCYFEIQNYEEAKSLYEAVLSETPDDINVKLSLAEVLYYNDEKEQSKNLLDEVAVSRKKVVRLSNDSDIQSNAPFKPKEKLTDEQIIEADERAKRKVLDTFKRMNRLQEMIKDGDDVAIDTWMQLASQLIELFTSVPSFFPRDKNRIFKGIVSYRRKKPLETDERLARALNLHEDISTPDNHSRSFLTSETEFRGLDYDSWFIIFVQYALFLKFRNNLEYGSQIIEIAMDVSVFIQDKVKESMLKLVRLVFGIYANEYSTTVSNYIRYFLLGNQFSPFIYKFFVCCFASGHEAWETFSNYNHQKYLLRQVKAYDSVIKGAPVSGMATITADVKSGNFGEEPAELLYIYATLLGGNRSNISSIVYLNRVYKHYNRDPMICLTLGISHVQRSMQRMTSNRHIQLLQGMSYIMEYRELRLINSTNYEQQEVEYNLGRVFHMIGLTTEAVKHYNKVLEFDIEDIRYDFSLDAAYNLSLIYNINGNSELAQELTQKYLTI